MAALGSTRSNGVIKEDTRPPPVEKVSSKHDGETTLPLSSSSSSTIHLELQQLQGELFDISDTNSSVAIILTKVQQLAKFENRIVEEQRLEIERLSCELKELRIQQSQQRTSIDGLESMPSFGNIAAMLSSNHSTTSTSLSSSSSSSSGSSAGYTNESERVTSYSLIANEKLANKAINLSLGIAETNYSKDVVRELEEQISNLTGELEELSKWKKGIVDEIEELKDQLQNLVKERNKLMQEVEVYTHQSELAIQLESAQKENIRLQKEIMKLRAALDMHATSTMERDIEKQQVDIKLQYAKLENIDPATQTEYCLKTLLTTEGHSASRKRTFVSSKGSVGEEDERSREHKRHHERPNMIDNGCLELIDGSTRVKSTTGGSDTLVGDTVSALHDADSVSLLFGPNSVDGVSRKANPNNIKADSVPCDDCNSIIKSKDDHDVIRAHAEKVLYWANRATERSKSGCSQSSVKERRRDEGSVIMPAKSDAASPSSSPIPETIGLPPRSQPKMRKSSQLPPRCPPSTSAVPSLTTLSSSSGEVETLDCNSTSSSSDKENGGSSFNHEVLGAFPTLSSTKHRRHQQKKNTSVVKSDGIICNLNSLDKGRLCCECSASPFSGNDPLSEFYLPKLGLACNCAGSSINEERECFSKNPTALSNILRPWQCAFLATLSITTADELLSAHRAGANTMARKMKHWRAMDGNNMTAMRSLQATSQRSSRECYVALKIWSRTCKVVLRSIREQKEQARRRRSNDHHGGDADEAEDIIIEKPHFLDISFPDMHTVTSISTLGQFSRETMEI